MTVPVFYVPNQSVPTDSGSPSSAKPAQVVADWRRHELDIEVRPFRMIPRINMFAAHDTVYFDEVMCGSIDNGFGNKDARVALACLWTSSSMVSATRFAAQQRKLGNIMGVCSPTSGFHHAGHDFGGGYCTFNGLMVAAMSVLNSGLVNKVGILDYDYHYGNGTQDIINTLALEDVVYHYSAGSEYKRPDQALEMLDDVGEQVLRANRARCELIIYQAGADQHIDDPLGGVLDTEQMAERDLRVFELCAKTGMPVVWNLAGGYQVKPDGSIPKVLEIHRNTMKACAYTFQNVHALTEPKGWMKT